MKDQKKEFKRQYTEFLKSSEGEKWAADFRTQMAAFDMPELTKAYFNYYEKIPKSEALQILYDIKDELEIEKFAGKKISQNELHILSIIIARHERRKSPVIQDLVEPSGPAFDPLTLIEPAFTNLYIEAEKKALKQTGFFSSAIRCAAFCEILYSKKYIINTNTRRQTIINFAKFRYHFDISKALLTSKENDRAKHKFNVVNKQLPLMRCFS